MKLSDEVKDRVPIAKYLAGIGVEVKGDGKKAMACCPFHADKNPSLSIDSQKGFWKCFACNIGGTVIDMHMRKSGLPFKDALLDLAQKNGIPIDEHPRKTDTYEYRDAYGRPVMKVDRIESGLKKKFRQYHTDETGAEKNGLDGVTRVLYRLDKWQGVDHVAICEGEKCVHALELMDMHATTNPGGSGGWLDAYSESLAGKHVEIWPDNDDPGEKWLDKVAESLAGKVAALKIIRVPKPYNDVADMVEAKGKEFAEEIVLAIQEAEAWIDRGIRIDLLSSREAYDLYRKRVLESESAGVDLGRWLPSLRSNTRPLMPGDLFSVLADTGVGKCLGIGTQVMMADGSVVPVESICVGDMVMGPDSLPRTVLALHSDEGELYRITPKNGDSFVCNENHMLTLVSVSNPSRKRVGGRIIDVPLNVYCGWTREQKHIHKLFKVAVNFPSRKVPIDPYWLGLWLGDGSSADVAITVADCDNEIADYCREWAEKNGHSINRQRRGNSLCETWRFPKATRIRGQKSETGKALLEMKIKHSKKTRGQKRIPDIYKRNDEAVRLDVLAGLIDSDGYLTKTGVYQVCGVNRELIEDCVYVARSLGFRASLKGGKKSIKSIGYSVDAYTATISGDIQRIPVKTKRKKHSATPNKDWMRCGFTIERLPDGRHYGFELTGDGRFLLGDFTVTHNTAILANIAYSQRPLPVIFFELELSPEAMAERFVARDTQTETLDVEKDVRNGIRHSVDGWSHVYTCPNTRIDVAYMEALILRSELKIGRKPALVLVDYIGLIGGGGGGGKRYERLSNIAEDLKRMARSTGTVVGMASQVRRDDDRVEIGLHDAKETGSIENSSQLVMGAWRTSATDMTIKILKQTKRAGQPEIACYYDGNRQTIREAYRGKAPECHTIRDL